MGGDADADGGAREHGGINVCVCARGSMRLRVCAAAVLVAVLEVALVHVAVRVPAAAVAGMQYKAGEQGAWRVIR